jgi:hypothetical protein
MQWKLMEWTDQQFHLVILTIIRPEGRHFRNDKPQRDEVTEEWRELHNEERFVPTFGYLLILELILF